MYKTYKLNVLNDCNKRRQKHKEHFNINNGMF